MNNKSFIYRRLICVCDDLSLKPHENDHPLIWLQSTTVLLMAVRISWNLVYMYTPSTPCAENNFDWHPPPYWKLDTTTYGIRWFSAARKRPPKISRSNIIILNNEATKSYCMKKVRSRKKNWSWALRHCWMQCLLVCYNPIIIISSYKMRRQLNIL